MSSLSDVNGNDVEDDLIDRSKKENLVLLLNNHFEQFKEISRAEAPSSTSQHRQKLRRQLTANVLKTVQDLLLLPLKTTFRDYRKSPLSAVDEILSAVLLLVDEWEVGDGQLHTALVDTLIRSYAAVSVPSQDGLQGLESFQYFVLLDLLPLVINGDAEKCYHAQSMIAKSLVQIVCSFCGNLSLTSPIIKWCMWQLDNIGLQHQCSSLSYFSLMSSEPRRFMLPPEVQELGLVLLRNIHSPHLLPVACGVVLDHVSVMATCNAINSVLLQKHAYDAVSALRQRLIDFAGICSQSTSDSERKHEDSRGQESQQKNDCSWQRQLAQVVVMALNDETTHQSELLTTAYLQQMIWTVGKAPQSPSSALKAGKGCDRSDLSAKTRQCKSDVFHPQLLALDWIVISFLVSRSLPSSKHHALLFEICDLICEFEQGAKSCCPFALRKSLDTAMEVVLLRHHDCGMENLYSPPIPSEESMTIAYHTLERGNIQPALVSGLLSMDVMLLLSSARAVASRTVELVRPVANSVFPVSSNISMEGLFQYSAKIITTTWVHDLTLYLYELLDSCRQEEFLAMLFHLVDETTLLLKRYSTPDNVRNSSFPHRPSKRTMASLSKYYFGDSTNGEGENEKKLVLKLVYSILHCLAENSPKSFIYFKDELIHRLLLPTFDEEEKPLCNDVIRPICKILVSLESNSEHCCDSELDQGLNCSDLLLLLQKLLFGEPARLGTARVVRGIALATELLETRSDNIISVENRNCIQDWVAQCLLPPTRRMVDPEIGLSGLLFLQSWIDRNETSDEKMTNAVVFHHFKMIVANTGLIQMVDSYQASGNNMPTSLLGYSSSGDSCYNVEKDSRDRDCPLPRSILFGICYFLRHAGNIESCPVRWNIATDWVYSLVDAYLRIGRTTASKNWQPNNWLLASLEFPLLSTTYFKRSVNAQNSVVEWISEKLCRFDLSDGIQQVNFFPSAHADTMVRCLSSKALRQLIDSANGLSLAFLIGISLSAAVLRNAFDHCLSLDASSHRFSSLLKMQLSKIYDLRAKSSTMDSFLSAIASALRRSLLRKKRATVILSDDSCEDSSAAVPVSSVRKIQDNTVLTNIRNTLVQNRGLRSSMFGSLKIIRCDIVWEALVDMEDCSIFHSSLVSMYTHSDLRQSEDHIMSLLHMVDLKVNLIRHAIIHFENDFLLELSMRKSYVDHCMSEIFFLLDGLLKLRRRCIDVMDVQMNAFNTKYNLLGNVVNLSSSYLWVLFLILKRSYYFGSAEIKSCHPLKSVPFDECLTWCDEYVMRKHLQTSATPLLRLFDFFSAQLTVSENFVVACNILEILSMLAFYNGDELLSCVIELSWTSLHTVYDTETSTKSFCPHSVAMWRLRLDKSLYTPEHEPLIRIVNRILSKLLEDENKNFPEFMCLRLGLIRHWGLLAVSEVGISYAVKHLSSLFSSLKSHIESLDVNFVSSKANDEEKNHEAIQSTYKKRKNPPNSSLFGLEAATISDYFETLLNMIVATAGALNPGKLVSYSNSSPYTIFEECYGLFRNMIEMYQASIFAFPQRSATTVTRISKDMLSIAFHQLQRCIDWRNRQPLLSNLDRAAGQFDIGSIQHLQHLIDSTVCHTAIPILKLCEFWQSSTILGYMKVSRIATVRLGVEKAIQRIKDVALSHNLSTSIFLQGSDVEIDVPTKGFHVLLPRKGNDLISETHEVDDPLGASNFLVEVETRSDTDDSFGVIGKWGDESDSNSNNDSVFTLNIDNSSASLPRKSL